MAATGKSKQLASDPPGGSRSGSKRRSGGSGAGLSSSYKPAAKRRRRTGVLRFFDGGDESEEDFHEDDGLLTEGKGKSVNNKSTGRSHPGPFFGGHLNVEELSGDELDIFVKDEEFTHLNEPTIWRVECMVGRERQMAFCFMQKFFDTKVPIISAFSLDHVRGFVFVEAEKACDVTEACKGLCNVFVNRISPVPTAEVPSLLSLCTKPFEVSPGTCARTKTGNYKGDDDDARPSSRGPRPRPWIDWSAKKKRKSDNNRSSTRSHPLPFLGHKMEEEPRMGGDELEEFSLGKNSLLQEAPATLDEPAIPTASTIPGASLFEGRLVFTCGQSPPSLFFESSADVIQLMNTEGFFNEKRIKSDNNKRTKSSHPLPFLGRVKEEELSGDELEEFSSKGDTPNWGNSQTWSGSEGTKTCNENQNCPKDKKLSGGELDDSWGSKVVTKGQEQQNDAWSSKVTSTAGEQDDPWGSKVVTKGAENDDGEQYDPWGSQVVTKGQEQQNDAWSNKVTSTAGAENKDGWNTKAKESGSMSENVASGEERQGDPWSSKIDCTTKGKEQESDPWASKVSSTAAEAKSDTWGNGNGGGWNSSGGQQESSWGKPSSSSGDQEPAWNKPKYGDDNTGCRDWNAGKKESTEGDQVFSQGKSSWGSDKNDSWGAPLKPSGRDDQAGKKDGNITWSQSKPSSGSGSSILGQWGGPPGDITTGRGGSVGGGSWGKSKEDQAFSQGKSSWGSDKNDSWGAPPKQSGGDDQAGKKDGNNTWSHNKSSSGGGFSILGAPPADTTACRGGSVGGGGSWGKGNEDGWNSSKGTGGSGLFTEKKRKSDNNRSSKRSHPLPFLGHEKEGELRMRGDELEKSSSKGKNSLLQEAPATHDEPAIPTASTISGFFTEIRRTSDINKRTKRWHPLPFLGHVKEEEQSGDELEEYSLKGKNSLFQEALATYDEPAIPAASTIPGASPGEEEQDQGVGDTTASPSPPPAARMRSHLYPAEEDIPLNTQLLLKIQDNQQKILLKLQDNQQKILKNRAELKCHGKKLKLIQHDMNKLVNVATEFENEARQILKAISRKLNSEVIGQD